MKSNIQYLSLNKRTGKVFVLVCGIAFIIFALSIRSDTAKTKQYLSTSFSTNPDNRIAQAKNIEQEKKLTQIIQPSSTESFDLINWIGGVFNSASVTTNSTKPVLKANPSNYNSNEDFLLPSIAKETNNYTNDINSNNLNFEIAKSTNENISLQATVEWESLLNRNTVLSDKISIGSELELRHLDKSVNIKVTDWRIMNPEISIMVSRDIFEKLGGNPNTQKTLNIQINKI